ncbi:hypothetical protein [Streptomyces sp. MNP-20]|uniref:hypothetical protein n=1 Tax=Streptomyces sp. MNP-20 TaxID=2721165 RepID=UPI00155739A9|nr:hypothetical protein [Streptomyces sp. MNP-20]
MKVKNVLSALGAAALLMSLNANPASALEPGQWMDTRDIHRRHCANRGEVLAPGFKVQSCLIDNGRGYAQVVLNVFNASRGSITIWSTAATTPRVLGLGAYCPKRTITDGKAITCVLPTKRVGPGTYVDVFHRIFKGNDLTATAATAPYDHVMLD